MKVKFLVFFTSFLSAFLAFGQDVLYTTSGSKLKVKVLEINAKDVVYKDFNTDEGPTYVISKMDIVLIYYANGVSEVINPNPVPIAPMVETVGLSNSSEKQNSVEKVKPAEKPVLNLYYLNKNMLSINALALANGDFTLMYDRDLLNSRMSVSFLAGYNFNDRMGGLNLLIADSKDGAKKKFDVGLGVNYMPRNTKRVQYFVGLLWKYMAYDYLKVIDTSNNQKEYQPSSAYQRALMLSNGWVYRISPNFNFKFFVSIGSSVNSVQLKKEYTGIPKMYLGYCFGYRF